VYCRDKTATTIKIVVDRINEYIREKSVVSKRQKDVERKGFDKVIYWVDGLFKDKEPPIAEKPLPEGGAAYLLPSGRRNSGYKGRHQ